MVDRINNFTASGDTEAVLLSDLNYYHRNPRRGDVDLVASSLKKNGQFKPITVNRGNKSKGGYKNEILAGNHTAKAASQLKWTRIMVTWVDVDDATAARIVAADNKTADAGTYENDELLALLKEIQQTSGNYTGTGYTAMDVKGLEKELAELAKANDLSFDPDLPEAPEKADSASFDEVALGDEPEMGRTEFSGDEDDEDAESAEEEYEAPETAGIEDADSTLPGHRIIADPGERMFDEGIGFLQFPKLRDDMFMRFEDIPKKLVTWAGTMSSRTADNQDPDTWWWYNWGSDSTSGMANVSQTLLAFYANDENFDNWWWFPDRYLTKVINSKIKYAITPNYSLLHQYSRVASLHSLYKSRYLGRFMQECGLKIVPDITWPDGDNEFLEKYVLATLPKGLPMICLQLQTIDSEKVVGGMEHFYAGVQMVFDTLTPKAVIIYGSEQARDTMKVVKPNKGCKIHWQQTRLDKIAELSGKRKKRTTI